jgi:hypothetical protein
MVFLVIKMKLNLESDINNDEVLKKKKPWYMGP